MAKKKILALLLCIATIASLTVMFSLNSSAATVTGTDGTLNWSLDDNGNFVISGTGAMTNFTDAAPAPWKDNKANIKNVFILSGVTSVGGKAFDHCDNLEAVFMANTVTTLFGDAFAYDTKMTTMFIPASVTAFKQGVVYASSNISNVFYAGTETNWSAITFDPYNLKPDGPIDPANVTYEYSNLVFGTAGVYNWDVTDTVLTISGFGVMPDFADEANQPWYSVNDTITKIIVEPGITTIGTKSFTHCDALVEVVIPEGVTTINADAFSYDAALTTFTLPISLSTLKQGVVYSTSNIATIYYNGTSDQWAAFVAANCPATGAPAYNTSLNKTPIYPSTITWVPDEGETTTSKCFAGQTPVYTSDEYVLVSSAEAIGPITGDTTYNIDVAKITGSYAQADGGWNNFDTKEDTGCVEGHQNVATADGKVHTFLNIDVNEVGGCQILPIMEAASEYTIELYIDGEFVDVQPTSYLSWGDDDCALFFDVTGKFTPVKDTDYQIELYIFEGDDAIWYTTYTSTCGVDPVVGYNVTWSVDGTTTSAIYLANDVPTYTGTPAKEGFTFAGWSDGTTTFTGAFPAATADVTYTAQFTKNVPTPPTSDLAVYAAIIVVIALAGVALVIKKERA